MKQIIGILILSVTILLSSEGGEAGFAVLKAPLTTWQSGIGEKMTVGRDASWTNPSALGLVNDVTTIINHDKWFNDINSNHIGIQIPVGNWVFSGQYYISQIDGIEVRTAPTEIPAAETDAHYLYGKLGVAYQLNNNIFLGISGKFLSEKIFSNWNQGYALDFAGLYKFDQIPLLISGLLANIGSTQNLQNEQTELPFLYALGIDYQIWQKESYEVNLLSEFRKSTSSSVKMSLGSELGIWHTIYIQLGYIFNDEYKSFTAGTQVEWQNFRLGVSWVPLGSDFGDKTSFSFNVVF